MNEIMRKTYLLVIMAALFAAFSCTKVEVIDVQGEVIAVKEVAVKGGTFMLPITVQNENKLVWKVRPLSEWLHVDDAEWKQNAYNVLVRCDSNESSANSRNFARVGHLVVEKCALCEKVCVAEEKKYDNGVGDFEGENGEFNPLN
jgi:hypothetical protein